MNEYSYLRDNLDSVRERLAGAAARAGRPIPRLVAVTKSATPEEFLALARLGVSDLAENRVQLLLSRMELLGEAGLSPDLHLIGSLQTNKAKYIVGRVRLVQSLDSPKLACELDRLGRARSVVTDVLVEVNSGREAAKGGVLPEDVPAFVASLTEYPNLRLRGLMTMGPVVADPEDIRPCFRDTRRLFESLTREGVFGEEPILSMGMSESYTVAAEEGATMVRVGRALFTGPDGQ